MSRVLTAEFSQREINQIKTDFAKSGYTIDFYPRLLKRELNKIQSDPPHLLIVNHILQHESTILSNVEHFISLFDVPVVIVTRKINTRLARLKDLYGNINIYERPLRTDKLATAVALAFQREKAYQETVSINDRYETIFHNIGASIIYTDTKCKIYRVNKECLLLFNVPESYLIGKDIRNLSKKFLAKYSLPGVKEGIKAVLKGDKVEPLEVGFRKRALELIMFSNVEKPGICAVIRDISTRKRLERASKKLNRELTQERNLFMKGPVVIVNWPAIEGADIEYVSPNIHDVIGYSEEDFLQKGLSWREILHPDDKDRVFKEVRQHVSQGSEQFEHEPYRLIRKDSKTIWVSDYTTVIRSRTGEIQSFLGYIVDITDRIHAEKFLAESEERFWGVFDNAPDASFVQDLDGNILEVNQAACKLHGLSREDLIGKNYTELVSPDHLEEAELNFIRMKAEQVDNVSGYSRDQEGRDIPVEIKSSRISFLGKPAILLNVRDVTRKQELEEQLRYSQKMEAIGQLAGGIAHEFNNLLAGVMGYSELGMSSLDKDSPVNDYFKSIIKRSSQGASLAQKLLAFSSTQILDSSFANINDLIKETTDFIQLTIGEEIEFKIDLEEAIKDVKVDLLAFQQIITNLCLNARDAMPNGGILEIKTRNITLLHGDKSPFDLDEDTEFVLMSVTDDGAGMDEETRQNIFNPFFTTKGIGKGVGLGLSMVFGLMNQHDGLIECTSEQGKGTTINLYFPAFANARSMTGFLQGKTWTSDSINVLVVEDDVDLLMVITSILKMEGFQVHSAPDGLSALEIYNENEIDLIISDIVLPKLSGVKLYEAIRTDNPNTQFIFMTGYSGGETAQRYSLDPELVILRKPFRRSEFLDKIKDQLDQLDR